MFASRKFPDISAEIFLDTAEWVGALAKRFEAQDPLCSFAPADPMEAALKLDRSYDS